MAKAKAETLESGPAEKIKWLEDVADHDYDAAEAYLSLKFDREAVHKTVKRLRNDGYATPPSQCGARTTSCVPPD